MFGKKDIPVIRLSDGLIIKNYEYINYMEKPQPKELHPAYIILNINAAQRLLDEAKTDLDKAYYKGMLDAWFILLQEQYPEAFNENDI